MRKILIAGLIVSHVVSSPAAAAPDIAPERELAGLQTGVFAGARLRVRLGGGDESARLRAGLVMAPTLRSQASGGRAETRLGEGLELGFSEARPLALSLAGRPLSGPRPGRRPGQRAGVSTLGWVAIGTAVVVVAGAIWFVDAMNDASE